MLSTDTAPRTLLADEAILDLYFDRDEEAITATDKKYRSYLYTIAHNIVRDRYDCEECLNDTYLGAWNRIPPERPSVFRLFLSRMTRNQATDRFRKRSALKRVPTEMLSTLEELDDCLPTAPSPEEELYFSELCRILNDYLHSLDETDEHIFVCRYYYADPVRTVAQMVGLSESAVYRRLESMRARLKQLIEQEETV